MPVHDIIDNRKEKLSEHISRILDSSDAARFAVGYFFLSGLKGIAPKLSGLKELRLLIGNTTNRETMEQLVEGYRPPYLGVKVNSPRKSIYLNNSNCPKPPHPLDFRLLHRFSHPENLNQP